MTLDPDPLTVLDPFEEGIQWERTDAAGTRALDTVAAFGIGIVLGLLVAAVLIVVGR